MTPYHDTLRLERRFDCSPERLFAAYADPRQREAWSAPGPDTHVEIIECDFRAGGAETTRCGPKGDLKYTLDVVYHVVEPDRTITFTEALKEDGRLLTVALVTFAIAPDEAGSRLSITDQITSLVGEDGVSGHRGGYENALVNLDRSLVPT